jgi:hypothetical protein
VGLGVTYRSNRGLVSFLRYTVELRSGYRAQAVIGEIRDEFRARAAPCPLDTGATLVGRSDEVAAQRRAPGTRLNGVSAAVRKRVSPAARNASASRIGNASSSAAARANRRSRAGLTKPDRFQAVEQAFARLDESRLVAG